VPPPGLFVPCVGPLVVQSPMATSKEATSVGGWDSLETSAKRKRTTDKDQSADACAAELVDDGHNCETSAPWGAKAPATRSPESTIVEPQSSHQTVKEEELTAELVMARMEAFIECNPVDLNAAEMLRKQTPLVQMRVVERCKLAHASNPSGALIMKIITVSQVTAFAQSAGLDSMATNALLDAERSVQRSILDHGHTVLRQGQTLQQHIMERLNIAHEAQAIRILIPQSEAHRVIGYKGTGLAKIRKAWGVHIHMDGGRAPDAWPDSRICDIRGPIAGRHSAVEAVLNCLFGCETDSHCWLKMFVPSAKVALLLARRGAMLHKLKEAYLVDSEVTAELLDDLRVGLLTLIGTVGTVPMALFDVMTALDTEYLMQKRQRDEGYTRLLMDAQLVASTVGSKGEGIAQIREPCYVNLRSSESWPGQVVFTLKGSPEGRMAGVESVLSSLFAMDPMSCYLKILIPAVKVGFLIGTEGRTICRINKLVNAHLHVQQEAVDNEHVAEVSGPLPLTQAIMMAKEVMKVLDPQCA